MWINDQFRITVLNSWNFQRERREICINKRIRKRAIGGDLNLQKNSPFSLVWNQCIILSKSWIVYIYCTRECTHLFLSFHPLERNATLFRFTFDQREPSFALDRSFMPLEIAYHHLIRISFARFHEAFAREIEKERGKRKNARLLCLSNFFASR